MKPPTHLTVEQKAQAFDLMWFYMGATRGEFVRYKEVELRMPPSPHMNASQIKRVPVFEYRIHSDIDNFADVLHHLATVKLP